MLNKLELLDIILSNIKSFTIEKNLRKHFPEHYQKIQEISFPKDFKFSQKLYHYIHDDYELKLGVCPICGKRCPYRNINLGYRKHCSQKCAANDNITKKKKEDSLFEHFGVTCTFKSKEIKQKIEDTNIKRYGCKNVFQNEEIQKRQQETCIKRYGYKNVFQNEKIKEKSKQTCLERYGVENSMQSEEIKEKSKQTCLERYGVENAMKSDDIWKKRIKNCIEKYGVEHPSKLNEVSLKRQETCLEKYGVPYYSQTNEFSQKRVKKYEFDGLFFDSKWEIKLFKYCKDHNISCVYQPQITFEYIFEEKIHYYHPDFLINGQLYEVKGEHFFNGDKMINPYGSEKNGLSEAKHQCMLKNGVIILRKEQIFNLDKIKF